MNRHLKKYNLKHQYLKLEEEDIRTELDDYIKDFELRFNKYYTERNKLDSESSKKEREVWVNQDTGEVRDTPPNFDEFTKHWEHYKKEQAERERKSQLKKDELKNKPEKLKRLYKKLSGKVHPDRGGDADTFNRVRTAFESNNLLYLLELASEYEIDYDIDPSDETILEKNINTLQREIERMKSTLAWAWGRGDKREVVAEVERQTKLKIDDSDLPDEIKTTPKNPPLLT